MIAADQEHDRHAPWAATGAHFPDIFGRLLEKPGFLFLPATGRSGCFA